ncbi:MAG: GNAT family N-acetyltransferase [Tannerellaceae bacterium]|jgi:GNAT superfamily N-acetyltransferase|nr:GNAT family N-acetyltransferase [Tannerellaceae bacterium]
MKPSERKKQIRTLWQKCFDDSEEFVEFYFEKVYRDENTLSLERAGRVVSAMQMIPYRMLWCETEITVAYVSGACTAPEVRGKGLMTELLHKAFREMRERGYDITALIPASESLFEYYSAYGYTEVFDYSLQVFERVEIPSTTGTMPFVLLDPNAGSCWFTYFDRQLRKRTSCILHSEDDFRNIITDVIIDRGLVVGALNPDGNPAGMAFITPSGGGAFIKEMFYDSEEIRERLLQKAAEAFQTGKVAYKTPPVPPETQRYGMAMILNREKMIRQWLDVHPGTLLSKDALDRMDSASLAYHLFGYGQKKSGMNLMLD